MAPILDWPSATTILAALIAVLLTVVEVYQRKQPAFRAAQRIPGKRLWPVFGNILVGWKLTNAGVCVCVKAF